MAQQTEQHTEKPAHRKRLLKWSGIALAALFALLLVGVATIGGILSSETGRLWLLREGLALGGLDAGPLQVQIDKARSPSLGEWRAERILITQEQQPWVDIRNFHLTWVPRELLRKRVHIRELSARTVDVFTGAAPTSAEPQPEQESGGSRLPAVAVDTFSLGRLSIHDTPQAIPSLTMEGNLRLLWDELPLAMNLQVHSLPEPGVAPVALEVATTAETQQRLRLTGSLEEAAGGTLGQLAQLPDESGIDLDFEAVVEDTDNGYSLTLVTLQMPFLQWPIRLDGELHVSNDLQTVSLTPLRIRTGTHQHRITGSASAEQLDLDVQLNQLPLAVLTPWVEQVEGGELSAELAIAGAPTTPQVSGHVRGNTTYQGFAVNLETAGEFSLEQLVFEELQASFGEARLQANGRLDLQNADSDLHVKLTELPADYATLFNVTLPQGFSGTLLEAEGKLRGDFRQPSGHLKALFEGQYQQQDFSARIDADGNTGRFAIDTAELQVGEARLQASGTLDLQGKNSNLHLTMDEIPADLAELANVTLPPGLKATLNGNAQLKGALREPSIDGEINASGVYQEQAFQLSVTGVGSPTQVQLRDARATVGNASLSASGAVDIDGQTLDMQIDLASAPLALLELAPFALPDGLAGEASGSARVHGSFSAPQVVSELAVDGTYEDLPFALVADGSLVDRRIDITQIQLTLDGTTALKVQGFLHPDRYDLSLVINDLPTRTLSALGWDLVTGEFDGNFHVQGTPDAPNIAGRMTYDGRLSGLDLATGEKTTFELGWDTRIQTEDQVLSLESSFTRDDQRTGVLQLSAPITRYLNHFKNADATSSLPIAFDAHGAVDLAVLSLVVDPDIHRISGRAALRMQGQGDMAQPGLTGVFELLDARYENSLTGTLLTDVQLLLKSDGTRVTIAEAVAKGHGDGRLSASGTVDWYDPQSRDAVDVTLTAKNANLLNREDLDGEVSGELRLSGSFEELWLKGLLDVTPLAANIDAAFQSQIPEIEVTEVYGDPDQATEAEPIAASVAPTIHLDLTIEAEQQAFLRGRGLEAELAGEIHLGGTLAEPSYKGEFNVIRGVFEVFGRKFVLDEGEVLFANNAIYIRIPGEYEHEDYSIRVEISGTAEDLTLDLSSVPTLPEDEILSLLIFGESVQDITPFQAIQLATAVRSLQGGGGGFDPINFTRDKLGVDTLSIESASTDSGTGVSVGVGKYLNDRVYLELKRTPSEVQPWQGSVEIQLSPRLHLRSTTGGEGRTRADLLWKRDF